MLLSWIVAFHILMPIADLKQQLSWIVAFHIHMPIADLKQQFATQRRKNLELQLIRCTNGNAIVPLRSASFRKVEL